MTLYSILVVADRRVIQNRANHSPMTVDAVATGAAHFSKKLLAAYHLGIFGDGDVHVRGAQALDRQEQDSADRRQSQPAPKLPVQGMPPGSAIKERQQEQDANRQARQYRGGNRFELVGNILQQLEQKEEIPFGAGVVIRGGGIRHILQTRALDPGQGGQHRKQE